MRSNRPEASACRSFFSIRTSRRIRSGTAPSPITYGGESYYRICQEVVLGIGGVRMLRALGGTGLTRYHMNEGHAALLGLELLDEAAHRAGRTSIRHEDVEAVRRQCVFTTHTPVASGHDGSVEP